MAAARIRKPRRHPARLRNARNCFRKRLAIAVGFKRHRGHFAAAMTALASLLQNRENVAIEGRRRLARQHTNQAQKQLSDDAARCSRKIAPAYSASAARAYV